MALTTAQIQNAYVAFFNRPADVAGLTYWSNYSGSLADLYATFAQQAEYTSVFTGMNNTAKVNAVYTNLLGRTPDVSGLNYWVLQLDQGNVTLANLALAIVNGAQGTDATTVSNKVSAATSYTNSLDTTAEILNYASASTSGMAAVKAWLATVTSDAATLTSATSTTSIASLNTTVASSTTTTAGQTFTLTTSANSFTGSTGDDYFDAALSSNGNQTLSTADNLTGGTGTDTLAATVSGAVNQNIRATLSSIEKLSITSSQTANTATIDLGSASGYTDLQSLSSTGNLAFDQISAVTVKGAVTSTSGNTTFKFKDAAAAGSADEFDLTLDGAGGTVTLDDQGGSNAIETVKVTATGSASTLTNLTTANVGTTKVTVAGSAAVNLGGALNAAILTVDASAATGDVTVQTGASLTGQTVTGGAGNDSLTIGSTQNDSVTAGAGNDAVIFAAGNFNQNGNDTVAGGDGTADVLSLAAVDAEALNTNLTAANGNITGFEQLTISTQASAGSALVLSEFASTINRVNLAGIADGNYGITGPAGALTVTTSAALGAGANDTFTFTDTGTASTDALTITNSNTGAVNVLGGQAFTSAGYESVTINTGATLQTAQTTGTITINSDSTTAATSLTVAGRNGLTVANLASNSSGLLTVDASGMTGQTTGTAGFVMSNAPTFSGSTGTVSVVGSAGDDTLRGHATANSTLVGGAGNDGLTGGTGNDSVSGGDGIDTINVSSGDDTVLGGAGNDIITVSTGAVNVDAGEGDDSVTVAATLTATDTIVGGNGTDTLVFSGNTAHTAAIGARISGFETITANDTLAAFNLSVYSANPELTRVNVSNSNAGTTAVTNASATLATLGVSGTAGNTVTFARATNTSADALTIVAMDNAAQTSITADGEETITLRNSTVTASANAATITTLAAAQLTTLNITGSGGVAVTNAITGATNLATVSDTHTGSGALTLDLSSSTVATTFTGGAATGRTTLTMGSGANRITAGSGELYVTGGTGAESITGGALADSISGGSGADTIIGGVGADTLTGDAGNDSISAGEGDDVLVTDSGADTIDGGVGTDTLTIAASFTDISVDTISNVETLNMANNASTMTVAQHQAFTTVSNAAAITFADAGTITGKTNVTNYTLANGTNTFTASSTAMNNVLTGGTGADTFNFGLTAANAQLFDANDTVLGGAGTDTVNFTGNVAFSVTLGNATKFTGIENVVFSNTSTAVTLVTDSATLADGESMTIDGSAGTTAAAIMTFNGSAEAGTGKYNLIGGGAADILTGGTGADTITGNGGADFIQNQGSGAAVSAGDVLTGGAGVDTFTLIGDVAGTVAVYTGAARVTDFVQGTDLLRFDSADASYTTGGLSVDGTAAGASGSVGVLTVAKDAATDSAASTTNELIKLTGTGGTVGVAFTTDVQGTFNAVIGTGTVANLTQGVYLVSFYDTTNSRAVFVAADTTATTTTTLEAGDTVRLIGTVDMTQASYNALTTSDFANFL